MVVKFDRAKVDYYILSNVNMTGLIEERFMTVTLTIVNKLSDGTVFQGRTTIRIILTTPKAHGSFIHGANVINLNKSINLIQVIFLERLFDYIT